MALAVRLWMFLLGKLYVDDCSGHKILVGSEILAAVSKSLKFLIEACCDSNITYQSYHWMATEFGYDELNNDMKIAEMTISIDRDALMYCSEELQNNREVVALAVYICWCFLEDLYFVIFRMIKKLYKNDCYILKFFLMS